MDITFASLIFASRTIPQILD